VAKFQTNLRFRYLLKRPINGVNFGGCFNELSDYRTEFLRRSEMFEFILERDQCYILKFLNCIVITHKNFSRLLNSSIIITLKKKPGTTAYKICLYNRA